MSMSTSPSWLCCSASSMRASECSESIWRFRLIVRVAVRTQGMQATVTNIKYEWFDKDMGEGVFYIKYGYADVEADEDLREACPEPSIMYAIGAHKVPDDSPLKDMLPKGNGYHVLHTFSEDGRKAKATWKVGYSCCLPDDCNL